MTLTALRLAKKNLSLTAKARVTTTIAKCDKREKNVKDGKCVVGRTIKQVDMMTPSSLPLLLLTKFTISTPLGVFAILVDEEEKLRCCYWVRRENTALTELRTRWYRTTCQVRVTDSACMRGYGACVTQMSAEANDCPSQPKAVNLLEKYFNAAPRTGPKALQALLDDVPVAYPPSATPFTLAVWRTLRSRVPAGAVTTYGALGEMVMHAHAPTPLSETQNAAAGGGAHKARAVGRAMATNPIPIVIPCHRVLSSAKALHGYQGGVQLKEWLLKHEGAAQQVQA